MDGASDAPVDSADAFADGCACAPGVKLACVTTCGSTGNVTCTPQCEIPSGCAPPPEICNGLDDDCVNGADDTFACKQFDVVSCATSCGSAGTRKCTATCSLPSTCDAPAEVCNSLDEDCDGLADNGLNLFGGPLAKPQGSDIRSIRVAYNGAIYAAAYLDLAASNLAVRVQRYNSAGAAVGAPIDIATTGGGLPSIAWNGSAFGIVWGTDGGGIYFRAVDATGTVQGPAAKVHNANAQSWVGITPVGISDFLLVFGHYAPPAGNKFYSARVTSSGSVAGTVNDITTSTGRITQPALVPSTSDFRAFWSDDRSGKYAIYSRPLDSLGKALGVEVGIPNNQKDASFWSAAAMPGGFVVGYSSFDVGGGAFIVKTDAGGAQTGQPSIVSAGGQGLPEVAWDGTRIAVLTGDEFQLRNTQLALTSKFAFWSPTTSNLRYPSLRLSAGRVFGAASAATTSAQVRLFGALGCNAP